MAPRTRSREPNLANEGFCFCCASRPTKPGKVKHVTMKPPDPTESPDEGPLLAGVASSSSASPSSRATVAAPAVPPAVEVEEETEEEASDEEAHNIPCSCGSMMRADAIFCRACGKKRLVMTIAPGRSEECDMALLTELDALAVKLRGSMQKFPKAGKKMFALGSGSQDRYFVVQQDQKPPTKGQPRNTEFQRWRQGTLSYFESQSAFKANEALKGSVELMQISKVEHHAFPRQHRLLLRWRRVQLPSNQMLVQWPSSQMLTPQHYMTEAYVA